jgi:hypothetical protein
LTGGKRADADALSCAIKPPIGSPSPALTVVEPNVDGAAE